MNRALLIGLFLLPLAAESGSAQVPTAVRVVGQTVDILSRPGADAPTVSTATGGTILEVVDRDQDWYLVSLPSGGSGASRHGWVQAKDVDLVHADAGQIRLRRQPQMRSKAAVIVAPEIGLAVQQPTLTNEDILALLKAGLPAAVVVAKIASSDCRFETSPDTLVKLRAANVPDAVLLAMVQAGSTTGAASAASSTPPRYDRYSSRNHGQGRRQDACLRDG